MTKFKLSEQFLAPYKDKEPNFGFNGLGRLVYMRTYSRLMDNGEKEVWWQTVRRVVESIYNIQKEWIESNKLEWNPWKAAYSAQEMYDRIFTLKLLPPGRGLWAAGSPITEDRNLFLALYNCAAVTTETMGSDPSRPFCFMMDALMCGCGVGFDVLGADKVEIQQPSDPIEIFAIPDSREGWVESLKKILDSYFLPGKNKVSFDYSLIRPAGEPISGFGGVSSGFQPLEDLHVSIEKMLSSSVGNKISVRNIADIMNMIGRTVVAGNIRRSAQLAVGPSTEEYLDLKNYEVNPERVEWGWCSNNSISAETGMDYTEAAKRTAINGEPGYIWLDNARKFGRMGDEPDYKDSDIVLFNPCVEIPLSDMETCVSGDTRILTRTGYPKIQSVVGQSVDVWNGVEWSTVVPHKTAEAKDLYRVTLSDGSHLDVTANHKWSVRSPTGRAFKQRTTSELEVGMTLVKFELQPQEEGIDEPHAYEYGWFAGDGFMDTGVPMATVRSDQYEVIDSMNCRVRKEQHPPNHTLPYSRVSYNHVLDPESCEQLRDCTKGLPEEIFEWNARSLRKFFGGWIDTDGSVQRGESCDSYRIYGTEQKLRDAQILLRRIGVNHASLFKFTDKGDRTNKGARNRGLWYLHIHSFESTAPETLVKRTERIGDRYRTNNAYKGGKPIDASRNQRVVSIQKLPGHHPTYCFTEPKLHMAVFGNCLTYQCNLCETFPNHHDSTEDYLRTLKYAYLYAKTVTLKPTHWPETNRAMLRNRRLGISMSGIAQFLADKGIGQLKEYCEKGYAELQRLDRIYSNWLCVPQSRRLTTCKPSGSVSLLAGATPGVHFPESRFYLRRVRLAKNSPMVEQLRSAGYKLEDAVDDPQYTVVVEIPVDVGAGVKTLDEVTIWEQLEITAFIQQYWSDNGVSATVTFSKEEEQQIKPALDFYQYRLKAISFLPRTEGGAFPQMPYEAIDEETYHKISDNLKPLAMESVVLEDSRPELYCDGDTCVIA